MLVSRYHPKHAIGVDIDESLIRKVLRCGVVREVRRGRQRLCFQQAKLLESKHAESKIQIAQLADVSFHCYDIVSSTVCDFLQPGAFNVITWYGVYSE